MWSGISGMKGTFVPPNSVHNTIFGAPRHGGETETIQIGERTWMKTEGQGWAALPNKSVPAQTNLPRLTDVIFVPDYITVIDTNVVDHIGSSKCLGELTEADRRYRAYEFDLYRDTSTERRLAARRRMFVDYANGLPVLFDSLDVRGQTYQRETRSYESGIAIEPPSNGGR